MAIAKHEFENRGYFARWLMDRINERCITRTDLAKELHMTPLTVYKHCKGSRPKFNDIVAYCWYFNQPGDSPYDIWDRVVEEFNSEEDY